MNTETEAIKSITAKARLNIADGVDEKRRNTIIWDLRNIIQEQYCAKDCMNIKKNLWPMYGGATTYIHYLSRCFSDTEMKCVGVNLDTVVHTKKRIPDAESKDYYERYKIINCHPQYTLMWNEQLVGRREAMLDEVELLLKFENIIYEFESGILEILDVTMEYVIENEGEETCQFDSILKRRK